MPSGAFASAAALFRFWEMREYLTEGRRQTAAKLLKLARSGGPHQGARARAFCRRRAAGAEQGDYASADPLIQESLDIARQLVTRRVSAVSLNATGGAMARDRGELHAGAALFEESLVLVERIWRSDGLKLVLSVTWRVSSNCRATTPARSLYAECLSIFQGLGDRAGVAWSLNYQGDVARDQGESAAARTLYEQGLAIFRELGDRWGIAGTLADLGNLAREQGNYSARILAVPGKHKNFPGAGPQTRDCPSAGVFRSGSRRPNSKPSVRCGWRARHRRCAKISVLPLTPAEQAKLEASLNHGTASPDQYDRRYGLAGRLDYAGRESY